MKAALSILCIWLALQAQGQSFCSRHDSIFTIKGLMPVQASPVKNLKVIPLNFATVNFGFFCKQELNMQRAHVPVAFRLGSMDYCNWLEQKPGYR